MAQKSVAGPEIERLIQLLAKLPGLGPRSARRAALHLIKKKDQLLVPLSEAMGVAVSEIGICSVCGTVDTSDPCTICSDPKRDETVLVVVEDVADLWALERAGAVNARVRVETRVDGLCHADVFLHTPVDAPTRHSPSSIVRPRASASHSIAWTWATRHVGRSPGVSSSPSAPRKDCAASGSGFTCPASQSS